MNYAVYDFRNALALLNMRPEWTELKQTISGISREDILEAQAAISSRRTAPAGAQQSLNVIFKEKLLEPDWIQECRLFESEQTTSGRELAKWAMDFVKRGDRPINGGTHDFGMGVEVSFNHSANIAWTLVRLDLASEGNVRAEARIDVGVAIYPTRELKKWGKMDGTVGTFEQACQWIEVMRPVIPLPLALVGLRPVDDTGEIWEAPEVFRGTRRRN